MEKVRRFKIIVEEIALNNDKNKSIDYTIDYNFYELNDYEKAFKIFKNKNLEKLNAIAISLINLEYYDFEDYLKDNEDFENWGDAHMIYIKKYDDDVEQYELEKFVKEIEELSF